MAPVSNWADQILQDPHWQWSAPLHYINTPAWACTYDNSTDCPNDMCVADAIWNYTNRLISRRSDHYMKEISVRFTIHFHGDIHQPLHVGFITDEGGNEIDGTYFGDSTNLHKVWDDGLIGTRIQQDFGGSQEKYTQYLISQLKGPWKEMATEWAKCNQTFSDEMQQPNDCPNQWASESAKVACEYAYTDQNGNHIENGFSLGQAYFNFAKQTLDEQLCKGGVRLASTLNKIWGSGDEDEERADWMYQ